jgi:hypothetical protein
MWDNACRLATGRTLVRLDQVDFAGILALAEPLAATARRLAEWEHAGRIGDTGCHLLRQWQDQWAALHTALAAAGLADGGTAWLEDPRREAAARALRELACDVRRGRLPNTWQMVSDTGEALTYAEVPGADLTPAVLAQRLAVAVEFLQDIVSSAAAPPGRPTTPATPTGDEQTSPVARAIALMLDYDRRGRRITVEEIARVVGLSRAALYRDPQFRAARAALKARRRSHGPPRGHKDVQGNVDAWDEEE